MCRFVDVDTMTAKMAKRPMHSTTWSHDNHWNGGGSGGCFPYLDCPNGHEMCLFLQKSSFRRQTPWRYSRLLNNIGFSAITSVILHYQWRPSQGILQVVYSPYSGQVVQDPVNLWGVSKLDPVTIIVIFVVAEFSIMMAQICFLGSLKSVVASVNCHKSQFQRKNPCRRLCHFMDDYVLSVTALLSN